VKDSAGLAGAIVTYDDTEYLEEGPDWVSLPNDRSTALEALM
jgi:hypothetical protein